MCNAIKDGGQRCAAHTRDAAMEALNIQLYNEEGEVATPGGIDALIEHASTPTGSAEIRAALAEHEHVIQELAEEAAKYTNEDNVDGKNARNALTDALVRAAVVEKTLEDGEKLRQANQEAKELIASSERAALRAHRMDILDKQTARRLEFIRRNGLTERDIADASIRKIEKTPDGWMVTSPVYNEDGTIGSEVVPLSQIAPESRASVVSRSGHARQKDKSGTPYWEHPEGVSRILAVSEEYHQLSPSQKKAAMDAAYLHDVAEDFDETGITFEDLKDMGFSEETLKAVDAVSGREGEEKDAYYARVMAAGPVARAVKLADLGHNNLPSRRSRLNGAPGVPVPEGGKEQYVKLGKKYAKAYKALSAPIPDHLKQFEE